MRITARVDYAVRAAVELAAAAPGALTCDRIAAAQGIPSRFLQSILGDLQHARLVTSQRGREGGYRLALPPSEVSIARVMRVEQGFLAEVHGQRPEDVEYSGTATPLAPVWVAAREAYRRVLEQVTVGRLLPELHRPTPLGQVEVVLHEGVLRAHPAAADGGRRLARAPRRAAVAAASSACRASPAMPASASASSPA